MNINPQGTDIMSLLAMWNVRMKKAEPNILDTIDIKSEMELIKQKKSKLSYSQRCWVES